MNDAAAFVRSSPGRTLLGPTEKLSASFKPRTSRMGYARGYQNSDQRSADLLNWLHRYNWHRPHGSLKAKTPISRLGPSEDNLLRLHRLGKGSGRWSKSALSGLQC